MNKRKYITPIIRIEEMEDEDLMFSASYTCTTSYMEDPSVDDDDYIHIHPDPIEPTEPIDGDDDY
ncbi:MAG: hypothetical protein IKQ47_02420 [Prevotella sp.]|nr:hypothetical protein [Prevotella sp.]MBR4268625.1 hypothetical protein [Prevotella sp.]